MELDVASVFTNICYDCVVMAHDEEPGKKTRKESEFKYRKIFPGESDAMIANILHTLFNV